MTFDLVGPIAYATLLSRLRPRQRARLSRPQRAMGADGLFNVGVAGFVAIGAYASALSTTTPSPGRLGGFALPIIAGWLAAMVARAQPRPLSAR